MAPGVQEKPGDKGGGGMRHRPLTPRAKRRRLAVTVIELGIVTGVIIGTMVACGFICALAGYA